MNGNEPEEPVRRAEREDLARSLETYRAYLLFIAWQIQGNRLVAKEGASDLVQRVMVEALAKVQAGNIPSISPKERKAWLRKILYNILNTLVRRAVIEEEIYPRLPLSGADPATSPSGIVSRGEQIAILAKAFQKLDPTAQQVVTWRYIDELTCEEIGTRLSWSASYVSRLSNQSLRTLRKALDD